METKSITKQTIITQLLQVYSIKETGQLVNVQSDHQLAAVFQVVNETAHDEAAARCWDVAETIPHHLALHSHQMAPGHQNACTTATLNSANNL